MAGPLAERQEGALQQWRRSADEHPHGLAARPVEPGIVQEARVEGRDTHEHGRRRESVDHGRDLELIVEEDRGPIQQRAVEGDEEAVGVIGRQGVQEHVAIPPAPGLMQDEGVG